MNTFTLFNVKYRVQKSLDRYAANMDQPILNLVQDDKFLIGQITICIPGTPLNPSETIIRTEFSDLIDDMEEADVLMFTGRHARDGNVLYPIVKLLF